METEPKPALWRARDGVLNSHSILTVPALVVVLLVLVVLMLVLVLLSPSPPSLPPPLPPAAGTPTTPSKL
jgi:hypothetical protein